MVIRDRKWVTFVYRPNSPCRKVFLVGSFNRWSPETDRMQRQKDGTFRRRLHLRPGRYEYKFLADGAWLEDPDADGFVSNEYGTKNCVLAVG